MKKVGIDLGKRQSDVCVFGEQGKVEERFQVRTRREALGRVFGRRGPYVIAIESGRDSGWVYEELTKLGHEVVVADTTRARTFGIGQGRRKTDRRDAEALARALFAGVLPEAHVLSKGRRDLRDLLHARDQLTRTRGRLVTVLRGQFQGRGFETPSCRPASFGKRLRENGPPGLEAPGTRGMLRVLDVLNEQIVELEAQLEATGEREEAKQRLCSAPGVGTIVALGFIAAIDEPRRFHHAHQLEGYLGFGVSEYSTGGKRRRGRITKCGNALARRLLVQAAHTMLLSRSLQEDPLVVWANQVATRAGRKKAVVALARRLAGVLWAMWVDGTLYDPQGVARASWRGLTRRARQAAAQARAMKEAAVAASMM